MNAKSFVLASAAAALFVGGAGVALAESHEDAAKIKCEGVNSCKGHSDCKTATNECKGQNACGGKGFVMMTPEECEKAKAEKE